MNEQATPLTLSEPPLDPPVRRRYRRPKPRFKPDTTAQLDPIRGCPSAQVPVDHLARAVIELVGLLDLSSLESQYSSLGRHGFHPRHLLQVWVYASLVGIHHASKLALALTTDMALRLLSGGHAIGVTTLKSFRQRHTDFLADAIQQTVTIAVERGLIEPAQAAVDGARIEADASTKSVRTAARSKKRLEELKKVDAESLGDEERTVHEEKLAKHEEAVRRCEEEGRTSHSITDPHAALMKFPNGASLPGHRVTVVACGAKVRFVVAALINAAPNDFGMLEEAVRATRAALEQAGIKVGGATGIRIQIAADPGYLSEADLRFAAENVDWVDVLIHQPARPKRGKGKNGEGIFDRERFVIHEDGSATCPAGRAMLGPFRNGKRKRSWKGDGCADCPLRDQCTTGKQRSLTQDMEKDRLHELMKGRMAQPDAKERYGKRIATVEPVFSYIEDAMGFRRSSSRKTETVRAELLLKVLAYNLMRLRAARSLCVCWFTGVINAGEIRILASWLAIPAHYSETPFLDREGGDSRPSGLVERPEGHADAESAPQTDVRPLFSAIV